MRLPKDPSDLPALRERLRSMKYVQLQEYARAARRLCRPEEQRTPPLSPYEILLYEAYMEIRRRYPNEPRRGKAFAMRHSPAFDQMRES
jgi:hypothetical protein